MQSTRGTTPGISAPILASDGLVGVTRLAVTDIARSIEFYEQVVGLRHLGTEGSIASLGGGRDVVLELSEERDARPAGRHAGLYHVAILYSSRLELARAGRRIAATGTRIQGASDHGSHEAIYLPDPDGNGLELAADRARSDWPDPADAYSAGPQPLDVSALLALTVDEPVRPHADEQVMVGHLHLHVGDIDEALAFYRDVVGLELQARLPTAAFVSVGGYHHHLGMNVWQGQGAPPAPEGVLGLRYWTMLVPRRDDVAALAARLSAAAIDHRVDTDAVIVRDPWNNELRVAVDG